MLKQLFTTLWASFEFHLDVSALSDLGVDAIEVDLHTETEQGGPYFLPMSQSRLQSFDDRPDFDPGLSLDDNQWSWSDAHSLEYAFSDQVWDAKDRSGRSAIDSSPWRFQSYVLCHKSDSPFY